ncbi:PAS domain S-box protein [Paracidovorax avenae]|uniref:PAS domain S-box protein n=1 Tax=Paracidovorax avenae TaxID=80867 RepID=UPI001F3349B7|nr:PAS domain S-box protein [Paracidovorax avenae]
MVEAEELFDRMPCGLLVTSTSGLILKVNRTLCQWTGIPPHELVRQKKLQELFTVGGRIFHQTHWQPMLAMQGAISEVKLDIRRGDGSTFPALLNVVRRTSGEDTFDEIAVMVAEERNKYERELLAARKRADDMVAKERQAQQALQASRSRLRQAMQSGAIHMWDLDPATGRRRFGTDVAVLLGLDPERPVGEDDFVAHVVPEDRAAERAALDRALRRSWLTMPIICSANTARSSARARPCSASVMSLKMPTNSVSMPSSPRNPWPDETSTRWCPFASMMRCLNW